MRLVSLLALLAALLSLPSSPPGPNSAIEQPDIGRSGTDFLKVCANMESEAAGNPSHTDSEAACLAWVEGFRDGFTVHDELLGVPAKDRMVCIPRGVTAIQTLRVIKKYLTDNPAKAHRPTRYNASVALARAFPCKAGT
jgi:hypothetical protein